jgi:hypothetical protein
VPGDEAATFLMADLYEQGKGVTRNVNYAVSPRSNFTFDKGSRLYDQMKYAEALVEFERSVKESPSVGRYQRIGWCQRKLGRHDEAIAAFKKGIDLATTFGYTYWVVLDLFEAALSANKPDEVFALFKLLEDKKWSAQQADIPYTLEREMAGIRAIALHMAERDAAEAEKKLAELVARPNMSSVRYRIITLDAWLKDSKPTEARQAAVKKILAMMAEPSRELISPYYPLKQGSSWLYRIAGGGQVTVRVAWRDRVGEHDSWLVETVRGGKTTASERIAVEANGVCRQPSGAQRLYPALCLLPLSPRAGEKWTIRSRTNPSSWFATLTGEGIIRVEDVTVPAGRFTGTIVAEVKTRDSSGATVKTTWYARDIGPVKIVTQSGGKTTTWELEKFSPAIVRKSVR